jgi:hypothetical protein
MDPLKNPFAPGAGAPPPELVGRQSILDQANLAMERIRLGRSASSLMIVGLRGVGKTVLLNKIGQISDEGGYLSEIIEIPEGRSLASVLVPTLRTIIIKLDRGEQINHLARKAFRTLRSFVSTVKVSYADVAISLDGEMEPGAADSGDIEGDIPVLLTSVGEAAKARKTAVALIIDELQYLEEREMSALIMSMHKISQRQLPLILIGAGLPQLVGLTGRSKSYSERLFDFPQAGALSVEDAMRALQGPAAQENARFTDAALNEIFRITEGYPYFIQEWGYQSWLAAPRSPIELEAVKIATPIALERLDRSFFRVRFDRLTPGEKRYLRAMAELGAGPHRSGDISAKMKAKVTSHGPVRASLITKGMIFSPQHGDTAFTVPLFDQFMKRIMPSF